MKNKFLIPLLSFSILFVIGAAFVSAQTGTTPPGTGTNPPGAIHIENPFKAGVGNSLFSLMKAIINEIVLPIGGVVAVLAFIYSGFLYVTAQGNESSLATAHKSLLYTAIGTAVLLGSWVLANVVCETIHLLGGPICPK